MIQRLSEYEAIIHQLAHENAQLKHRLAVILDGHRRMRYPEGTHRSLKGRAILTCSGCHRVTEIRARGLCVNCYAKLRRSLLSQHIL